VPSPCSQASYADRLAEHVEQLAHHAIRGEVWEKAVHYLRQAGTRAFTASANREAATCFGQALDALAHLPEIRETAEQGIDLRFDLRNVLFLLGEFGRGVELLREADRLARALGDSRRLGWVSVYMSFNRFLMDDSIQQRVFAEHAPAIAEMLADVRLQARRIFSSRGVLGFRRDRRPREGRGASDDRERHVPGDCTCGSGWSRRRRRVPEVPINTPW
jgi:hypothetical protein